MTVVSRPESRLNSKLDRKIAAYALAAGAAGVGLTAHAPSAEASVIYTPVHENALAASPIDINNDGTPDFGVDINYYCNHACNDELFAFALGTSLARGGVQMGRAGALARKDGGRIGPRRSFFWRGDMAIGVTSGGNFYQQGYWANVNGRYLGLMFKIGDEVHYGWARFNVQLQYLDGFIKMHAVITGYAYETDPNKPIVAGDEGQDANTLGHLALGAVSRKQVTAPVP